MAKKNRKYGRVLFWGFCLQWARLVLAAEPPADPILRIDPGMHTAPIERIAVDARGRWLVTASTDKTARVWDLTTGQLLNVLRPPIGPGYEGTLGAVALSPDGETVALGGNTQFNNGRPDVPPEGDAIYLFHRASGRLFKRVGGLPNSIYDLAFSPDGRYLAASLGHGSGMCVYRSDAWDLVGQDTDYGARSQGADFSRDGRLVTTSFDGYIRLYRVSSSGLGLLAKQTAPGGKQPDSVRFSPDGRLIAVGFMDTPAVNLLDGSTLALRYAPDTPRTNLDVPVAWSADNQTLFSAHCANRACFIRQWPQAGQGTPRDTPAAENSVTDLRALPHGGVAFAATAPAWGLLDAGGHQTRFVGGPIVQFRNPASVRLAHDGRTVGFSYERSGKSPAVFDPEHGLSLGEHSAIPLAAPRIEAPGLAITDWEGAEHPRLNGTTLPLRHYEVSLGLAIDPDGEHFAVGTVYYTRLFDRNGTQRWQIDAPGQAFAVNISGDGHTVVAALGDGTIRWYDIQDGREKLAFFPHADRKRWVAWTPSGYYQASPGGEDLIGWHLNHGKDAAGDFFPASRFRAKFNRPDVVARAISAPSEAEALRLADAEAGRQPDARPASVQTLLPPVVQIASPPDGTSVTSSSVTVRYATRSPADAPVTGLRARVNGRAVTLQARAITVLPNGMEREVSVPIREEDSEIQLFAENKNGVSTPAILRVTWAGKAPVTAQETMFKPKLYVLAVGVAQYANEAFNLGLPAKDARDFAAVLMKQKGRLYADVQVRLLTDAEATKDSVLDGLEWLQHQVTARDVGMTFLAGHGMNDNNGRYYFLPHNADPEKLLRTGVPQSDIRDTLSTLAGKAVFFVDTCHSGNALGTAKTRGVANDINAFVNELTSAENGVVVFTASTGRQLSLEDPAWGNGAFTKAVVEGLSGKADFQKSGRITVKGLDYYIDERVKELTSGRQSPVSIAPGGIPDFPIAVVAN
jgi:WD40 repeat protein